MPEHADWGRTAILTLLLTTGAAASAQVSPPKPRLKLTPPVVPAEEVSYVTLSATLADGSPIDPAQHTYTWVVSGGSFVNGTGPDSPEPRLEVDGTESVDVQLLLNDVPGAPEPTGTGKGATELGLILGDAILFGDPRKWHPLELWFPGPFTNMDADAPNPFLDRRLDVTFTRPNGTELVVPGFYDGNGFGSPAGNVWKVRLTPDLFGNWTFEASFRGGTGVAVADDPLAGTPLSFDGASGNFFVLPRDSSAPGFLRDGRLDDVGEHYRRQVDGGFWLKSGADSPENLLAFAGFADPQKAPGSKGLIHRYEPHAGDWSLFDPELPLAGVAGGDPSVSRNIYGALNYLSGVGVNSVYFLPMNLGGDGQDTTPFVGYGDNDFDKTHYNVTRLHQWESVFRHAQRKGIQLLMVLAETEAANEQWLDDGELGPQRKLFMRELVARFAHHNALKWCLSEENDFASTLLVEKAQYLADLDAYDHAIAVHNKPFGEDALYQPLLGDPNFSATSIQYTPESAGQTVEYWRAQTAASGKRWAIDMDENNPAETGASPDNADYLRKTVLYDIYFSGGQVEWYLGGFEPPVGGDLSVEDFRTREEIWLATKHARQLLEVMPFHRMEPMDAAVYNAPDDYGGAEVFGAPGEAYAIYLPNADADGAIQFDLTQHPGPFQIALFDPRSGYFVGTVTTVEGGQWIDLPVMPAPIDEDWVIVVRRPPLWTDTHALSLSSPGAATFELDGTPQLAGQAWFFMASTSGTLPGVEINGFTVPLVGDAFFDASFASPGILGLNPYFGVFGVDGRATTTLTISPFASPSVVGTNLYYAWVAAQLEPFITYPVAVSNPVVVKILP